MINISKAFKTATSYMRDLIFPRHIRCIFCGNEIEHLNPFDCCDKCSTTLPYITKDFCLRCGAQMADETTGVCLSCKMNNYYFDKARAVFVYEGFVRRAIHKMKIGRLKYNAEPLGYALYEKLKSLDWKIDFICYTPMHAKRLKFRGYNQAEELAKYLSDFSNIPLVNCFEKIKETKNQTSLSGKERQNNLKGAFKLIYKDIKDKSVLIVDDIYTTGATTNELSKLVREKGANKIYVLTVAHTPPKKEL